jgi:hypothetical protein
MRKHLARNAGPLSRPLMRFAPCFPQLEMRSSLWGRARLREAASRHSAAGSIARVRSAAPNVRYLSSQHFISRNQGGSESRISVVVCAVRHKASGPDVALRFGARVVFSVCLSRHRADLPREGWTLCEGGSVAKTVTAFLTRIRAAIKG